MSERFQADGYYWQVYESKMGLAYTALAKELPFVYFAAPLNEPWDQVLYFEFGATPEEALAKLRASLGLEAK